MRHERMDALIDQRQLKTLNGRMRGTLKKSLIYTHCHDFFPKITYANFCPSSGKFPRPVGIEITGNSVTREAKRLFHFYGQERVFWAAGYWEL